MSIVFTQGVIYSLVVAITVLYTLVVHDFMLDQVPEYCCQSAVPVLDFANTRTFRGVGDSAGLKCTYLDF